MAVPEPHVATSGQIRPEQMDALQKAGFALVVSLRTENEPGTGWEEFHALDSGLSFVRLPVPEVEDLSPANVQRLAWLLASVRPEQFVLVYCNSGNRAGALLALKKAWIDGMDHQQALVYARKAGATKLMSVMEALLDA